MPADRNFPNRLRCMLLVAALVLAAQIPAAVTCDPLLPQLRFAAADIEAALAARGEQGAIVLTIDAASDLKAEGFAIVRTGAGCRVVGKDAAGAMYGGLDVAETIRSQGFAAVQSMRISPHMAVRGVKFNIPLDVRTPSYSDVSDAAQKNIAEMWSMDFWKEYIDTLARHRYNFISLWSMHPFPSLVKVPAYPDIALADVKRSKGPFKEYYSLRGTWNEPELQEGNLETLKTMTIDEKIAFWRAVMAYGKSRNVDFAIVTWNIFVYGTEGKYGITDDPANPTTIDYFRHSVRELITTYPDLAGIGITAGENMVEASGANADKATAKGGKSISAEAKEDWMVKTYVAGTLDALKAQPGRKFRFIHRQHEASTDMILRKMDMLIRHPDVNFVFSFKYADAHVYSATQQYKAESFIPEIRGKVKTLWTLRNDDVYLFRWGAPDFVRAFIKGIPMDVTEGCYYGHDGFISGREFTQRDAGSPRPLEISKHWMQWMLWGRLAYDPDYSNARITALLQVRFPEVDAGKLLTAWQQASMVYPRVTGFHWGSLDFMWYIEGMRSEDRYAKNKGARTTSGFHDVETFIKIPPHKYAGVMSIPAFVAGKPATGITPLVLADLIDQEVESAATTLRGFGAVKDQELRQTLADIAIICAMGRYYADKIRGATHVAMARTSGKAADKDRAIAALTQAAEHYRTYADLVKTHHVGRIWFNRVGILDFDQQMADALADIAIAQGIETK